MTALGQSGSPRLLPVVITCCTGPFEEAQYSRVFLRTSSLTTMLTRRFLAGPSCRSTSIRLFSTSNAYQRTPSLADVTPHDAPSFDARQEKFREGLKAAQELKAEQDSQSVTVSNLAPSSSLGSGSAPTAQDTSNASLYRSSQGNYALGSLSTHSPELSRENSYRQENSKRKGTLSSLIYGTHEGRQMDQEIEKSFSQVLARGKYVHSIVFHQVKPDKVDEYVELVGSWYPRMANIEENHVHLVGSWRTEVGDCDTFGMSHFVTNASVIQAGAYFSTQSTSGSTSDIKATTHHYTP